MDWLLAKVQTCNVFTCHLPFRLQWQERERVCALLRAGGDCGTHLTGWRQWRGSGQKCNNVTSFSNKIAVVKHAGVNMHFLLQMAA